MSLSLLSKGCVAALLLGGLSLFGCSDYHFRRPVSMKSPCGNAAGAASLVDNSGYPPTSALKISPKRSQVSPLKRINCSCESGAKSVAEVLTLTPGNRPPGS